MQDLLKIALVGTGKHSHVPLDDGHTANRLLRDLDAGDREQLLLLQAGVQSVYQQAGRKPEWIPEMEPAPDEQPFSFSSRMVQLFHDALSTVNIDLLRELVEAFEAQRLTLPHEVLPQALDVRDANLRKLLMPILGERGRWLSQFRPEWSWATEDLSSLTESGTEELRRMWDEGNISERCRSLARLRQANPQQAVEWMADTFKKEKPQNRAKLLEQLQLGLCPEDEPFLEDVLSDRSEPVRAQAALLLSQLPNSSLSQRMCARADTVLEFVQTSSGPKLQCHPPETIETDWVRDGIPKSPPGERRKRAFWTERLLALVPIRHWSERFCRPPAELLRAVTDDQFAENVITGWTTAVVRAATRDTASEDWALALWDHWRTRATHLQGSAAEECLDRLKEMLAVLQRPAAEHGVLQLLMGNVSTEGLGLQLLSLLPRPWSADFSCSYLLRARQVLKTRSDSSAYRWSEGLALAARSIPRESFAVAAPPWEFAQQERSAWRASALQRDADRFLQLVQARENFYAELYSLRDKTDDSRTPPTAE